MADLRGPSADVATTTWRGDRVNGEGAGGVSGSAALGEEAPVAPGDGEEVHEVRLDAVKPVAATACSGASWSGDEERTEAGRVRQHADADVDGAAVHEKGRGGGQRVRQKKEIRQRPKGGGGAHLRR